MKKILRGYQYLFYRVYMWQLRLWGKSCSPEISALCAINFLILANFLTFMQITQIVTGYNYQSIHLSTIQGLFLLTVFMAILCKIFLRKNKYLIFIKEFEREKKISSIRGSILIWCYIISTIALLIFFTILSRTCMDKNISVFSVLSNIFFKMIKSGN